MIPFFEKETRLTTINIQMGQGESSICKKAGPYLVEHECDCKLYYNCGGKDSKELLKKCPFGLHFNKELLLCDDPKRSGCKLDGCNKKNNEIISIRIPNLENIIH
ncbi:hypothetical protein DICPUDRAFT_75000 [Dictyostelium purpureum]|uniref:Chitin-binding type-2 domain-containing protein n=1 Tax=Dictyostelium purpureum TaxID=5786 RepID=F0Z9C6_DICPU|nr:uncharacterized protein DICPUDRAFT_75000 [Dictyostelium purpureum]EGC39477.1 hypothetical protein DICPUDRAFT_75000 [Dictyostelium purpureum]|eukprot:XP_003284035.1 hypothetical protein DICPUDRAFT_75000 [Dictyostelium purpureum]